MRRIVKHYATKHQMLHMNMVIHSFAMFLLRRRQAAGGICIDIWIPFGYLLLRMKIILPSETISQRNILLSQYQTRKHISFKSFFSQKKKKTNYSSDIISKSSNVQFRKKRKNSHKMCTVYEIGLSHIRKIMKQFSLSISFQ